MTRRVCVCVCVCMCVCVCVCVCTLVYTEQRFWQRKNRKAAGGLAVRGYNPQKRFSNLHLESLGNTWNTPWIENLKPKNNKKTLKSITMYTTHRRCYLKIGSKNRFKHNMETVFITFRKKRYFKVKCLICFICFILFLICFSFH